MYMKNKLLSVMAIVLLLPGCQSSGLNNDKPKIIQQAGYDIDPRVVCEKYNIVSNPDVAVECYENVARSNPLSPRAQFFLGVAYIWANDLPSTHKQFEVL